MQIPGTFRPPESKSLRVESEKGRWQKVSQMILSKIIAKFESLYYGG